LMWLAIAFVLIARANANHCLSQIGFSDSSCNGLPFQTDALLTDSCTQVSASPLQYGYLTYNTTHLTGSTWNDSACTTAFVDTSSTPLGCSVPSTSPSFFLLLNCGATGIPALSPGDVLSQPCAVSTSGVQRVNYGSCRVVGTYSQQVTTCDVTGTTISVYSDAACANILTTTSIPSSATCNAANSDYQVVSCGNGTTVSSTGGSVAASSTGGSVASSTGSSIASSTGSMTASSTGTMTSTGSAMASSSGGMSGSGASSGVNSAARLYIAPGVVALAWAITVIASW